jgi:phosphohistidine phosphatase
MIRANLRQTAAARPRYAGGLVNLLVIRHAVAEDRETFAEQGKDDSLRPLTDDGRRKMQRAARGIQSMVPSVGVIATSPFVRATQTAQVVGKVYRAAAIIPVDALTPDADPRDFLAWLDNQDSVAPVAAVGHEPHLGSLVWWLLTGERAEERIRLRKGGACLLDFDDRPRAGSAALVWSIPPSALRRLAG